MGAVHCEPTSASPLLSSCDAIEDEPTRCLVVPVGSAVERNDIVEFEDVECSQSNVLDTALHARIGVNVSSRAMGNKSVDGLPSWKRKLRRNGVARRRLAGSSNVGGLTVRCDIALGSNLPAVCTELYGDHSVASTD